MKYIGNHFCFYLFCSMVVLNAFGQKTSTNVSEKIVVAARAQIGETIAYDPAYRRLAYPNGDVPIEKGVCTDVVIRALRTAVQMDLQKLVHEDMKAHFDAYPKNWGLKKPDTNIDHRRVPNLQTFFKRKRYEVPVTDKAVDYRPGDIVTCTVGKALPHIMIVSDKTENDGKPLVIHNIGRGVQEEECLFSFPLTGHYRVSIPQATSSKKRTPPVKLLSPLTEPMRHDLKP